MGLTGLKSRYKHSWFLSEGGRAESCPSQFLEATYIPWFMTLFHLQSQQWLWVFLTSRQADTLFCLPSFVRTFVIILGLHEYSRIISLLEGQMISNPNSIHNLNSPLPCNTTYSQVPGTVMWTSLLRGRQRRGLHYSGTTAIYNPLGTLEFNSNFFTPSILYSSKRYLTTYSKYQMSNDIENSDTPRIRSLSNFVTDSEFQWGDVNRIYI